jgi:hypothetical protein
MLGVIGSSLRSIHSGNCIRAGVFGFVGVFAHKNGVKRNVKRGETRPDLGETRPSIFEGVRFVLSSVGLIGERPLERPFVSRFRGIGVKCETKPVFVKRAWNEKSGFAVIFLSFS